MNEEIAERMSEYAKEAETAAANAREAREAVLAGDAEGARKLVALTHQIDGYRQGVLDAFDGETSVPPVPWSGTSGTEPRFTRDTP